MTWEQIQKAALDKIFSRLNYGTEVSLTSPDVADYVRAMPHAAWFAMVDLAEVMPIYKSVEVELPDDDAEGYRLFHIRELAPDFMRFCPDRLTIMGENNTFMRVNDYQFDGMDTLFVPAEYVGTLVIWYEAYPENIDESTPGDTTFSLPEEAQRAIPLYIAAEVFKEDDISMATQYLNEYENVKQMCSVIRNGVYVIPEATMKRAAKLTRELMAKYHVPVSRVCRHYDVTHKDCPEPWVRNPQLWQKFKTMLTEKEVEDMTEAQTRAIAKQEISKAESAKKVYNSVAECPAWAKDTVQKLVNKGFLQGDDKGKLALSTDLLRLLVINDRAHLYG